MSPFLAARSVYATETVKRAAKARTAAAVVAAAVSTAPLTTTLAAPSGGTAAGRVGLAVPLARGLVISIGRRRPPGAVWGCGHSLSAFAIGIQAVV